MLMIITSLLTYPMFHTFVVIMRRSLSSMFTVMLITSRGLCSFISHNAGSSSTISRGLRSLYIFLTFLLSLFYYLIFRFRLYFLVVQAKIKEIKRYRFSQTYCASRLAGRVASPSRQPKVNGTRYSDCRQKSKSRRSGWLCNHGTKCQSYTSHIDKSHRVPCKHFQLRSRCNGLSHY